ISERLDAETVVSLLNDYLSAMTEIILEEEGTVDKFEGDAIMALWGAPWTRKTRRCGPAGRRSYSGTPWRVSTGALPG
ncbi:MAG: adenylate/guanylate cyclase domain-containing protein, partial [Deltaproteobacteria bacterium]|nr:adenylate/guanylate cyclase domain-containing protein [Deltaproteobacteria bacterium]